MEQLGFEGMPRRLYSCTPTRLSAWLDCPRRYRMSYLDRPPPPKGPPWAHNSLGASVHNALAGWWRLPQARRTVAAAGTLVDRGWIDEGFADETQSVRQRERAVAMVEGYVAGLDPADEPLGVERTVATRTDKIAVSGRIDRLDARPGAGCGGRATGWNSTTCPPARSSPGRTPMTRWPGTSAARKISPRSARPPTSGCATACPPTATTRCSRPARAPRAAGATTAATAQKAPKPPRPAAPGTASPRTDPERARPPWPIARLWPVKAMARRF